MAFRTNKTPAIEERTVSGSSVSFNSAFALPLKKCKITFEATQAGSGDPSPSNPRAISGVSAIGLTANSTPVSVSLGEERYGGVLNVLTGILTITDVAYKIKDLNFSYTSEYGRFQTFDYSAARLAPLHNGIIVEGLMCECYISGRATSGSGPDYPDKRVAVAANSSNLFIYDSSYTDVNTMKSAVGNYYIKWRLKESGYITIQLTPTQLSSILGNNTFSTDTGTLEITFADLQEKSASGSVATFNTALAMPLVECKTEFMCTQEAGTPTPSNPLAITGVDEVGIWHGGKNLIINSDDEFTLTHPQFHTYNLGFTIKANTQITISFNCEMPSNLRLNIYNSNGTVNLANSPVGSNTVTFVASRDISAFRLYVTNSVNLAFSEAQLEVGSTATDYEAYNGTVTLIDLDGTRYGGYVDVVGKKLILNRGAKILTGNENFTQEGATSTTAIFKLLNAMSVKNENNQICSHFKYRMNAWRADAQYINCFVQGASKTLFIQIDNTIANDATEFKRWLSDEYTNNRPVTYVCNINDIEIDLSDIPTLSTIIGNNSFASDSGSIELKFKDLDIAKRGNFREVFKLPS